MSVRSCVIVCAICIGTGLLMLALRPVDDPPMDVDFPSLSRSSVVAVAPENGNRGQTKRGGGEWERKCATVEEMGEVFKGGFWKESLRVRTIIEDHFALNGM